jgi:Dyp-type peroxidase family
MKRHQALDLADIQGNIHRPYGRFGFPHTRHLLFHISRAEAGRRFVQALRARVTTAEPWEKDPADPGGRTVKKPTITLNIGFTYGGLRALDLPTRTLRLLPDEFIDGMRRRAEILGDGGPSAPAAWDPVWRRPADEAGAEIHVWVSLNAAANPDGTPAPALAEWTLWLQDLATGSAGGVALLGGHGADGVDLWQDSAALMTPGPDGGMAPTAREHFGFTDGIGDPVFAGQLDAEAEAQGVIGGGKIAEGPYDVETSWGALETGEFILGHVDEGQELPVATQPGAFAANGTFMVLRKLRQDVVAFEAEIARQAAVFQKVTGLGPEAADLTVRAKIVGRWPSGIPLMAAPTWEAHQRVAGEFADCPEIARRKPGNGAEAARLAAYERMLTAFRYGDDLDGSKCPFGAHVRRGNPRDMLDPLLSPTVGASTLTNRRRILRRGLPYIDGDGERGVIFMAICASPFRQFEFVQQQWMNYGLDFEAGNDTCPLVGDRSQSDKHVIPAASPEGPAFIAAGLPQFVTTRGGDYFFLPSLSALRMLAMGTVDPT